MNSPLHLVGPLAPDDDAITDPTRRGAAHADGLLPGSVCFVDGQEAPVSSPGAEDLPAHELRFGRRPHPVGLAGDELLLDLERSELAGRGGGHFPVAAKWRSVLAAGGDGVVVGNGAESEPLSAKDAALMQVRPHLVLDGLACAAAACGAADTVLWLHESDHGSRRALARAITERRDRGETAPRVVLAAEHYLSGESSVIVSALSGGPALPQFHRRPATEHGVNGRPTLVHNVETLARIGLVARGIWLRTRLATVAVGQQRTVVEIGEDEPLRTALTRAGHRDPVQAVLLGGFGGRWRHGDELDSLTTDHRDGARAFGAGILMPIGPYDCGLTRTAAIVDYLARSSARQCGPCLFGLRSVADLVAEIVSGKAGRRGAARLQLFLGEIAGRGACHHPDGAVNLVASAVTVFAQDLQHHRRTGRCSHG